MARIKQESVEAVKAAADMLDVVGIVLSQREEDRSGAQEHSRDTEPPGAIWGEALMSPSDIRRHRRSLAAEIEQLGPGQ